MADEVEKPPDPRVPSTYSGMREVLSRFTLSQRDSLPPRQTYAPNLAGRPVEQSQRSSDKAVSNPSSDTTNPMHKSDRKFFSHLGIPGAILVGAGLVGLAAIFSGWPHTGFALATACFLGAFVMWLRLSETKLKAPPEPLSVVIFVIIAIMTCAFIGSQTWLWLHTPMQGYTQAQLDKAVEDGKAPLQSELDAAQKTIAELKNTSPAPTGDLTKLAVERDKANRDRDAAIKDLEDTQHKLNAMQAELDAARAAAAARTPGALALNYDEVGAAVLLYRTSFSLFGSGNSFEVMAKSTNVRTLELQVYQQQSNGPYCGLNCLLARFIFDGSYGPFEVSANDPDVASQLRADIAQNGEVRVDVVVDPGMQIGINSSGLCMRLEFHSRNVARLFMTGKLQLFGFRSAGVVRL